MKKTLLSLGATMFLAASVFVSCKKEIKENVPGKPETQKVQTMSAPAPADVSMVIKSHYGFQSVDLNVDATKDVKLMELLKKDAFVTGEGLLPLLDMSNATYYHQSETKLVIAIPFLENGENKVLMVGVKNVVAGQYVTVPIVYHEKVLDANLDGTSTMTYLGGYTSSNVIGGVAGPVQTYGLNAFQTCMQDCYNAICDGLIGCIAWYTNPEIAVMCAVYCAVQTS